VIYTDTPTSTEGIRRSAPQHPTNQPPPAELQRRCHTRPHSQQSTRQHRTLTMARATMATARENSSPRTPSLESPSHRDRACAWAARAGSWNCSTRSRFTPSARRPRRPSELPRTSNATASRRSQKLRRRRTQARKRVPRTIGRTARRSKSSSTSRNSKSRMKSTTDDPTRAAICRLRAVCRQRVNWRGKTR
jgi:hypothetical protein